MKFRRFVAVEDWVARNVEIFTFSKGLK